MQSITISAVKTIFQNNQWLMRFELLNRNYSEIVWSCIYVNTLKNAGYTKTGGNGGLGTKLISSIS